MRKLLPKIGAALIITIILGTMYATVQRSLRLTANDPQIELAEDVAASLGWLLAFLSLGAIYWIKQQARSPAPQVA